MTVAPRSVWLRAAPLSTAFVASTSAPARRKWYAIALGVRSVVTVEGFERCGNAAMEHRTSRAREFLIQRLAHERVCEVIAAGARAVLQYEPCLHGRIQRVHGHVGVYLRYLRDDLEFEVAAGYRRRGEHEIGRVVESRQTLCDHLVDARGYADVANGCREREVTSVLQQGAGVVEVHQ